MKNYMKSYMKMTRRLVITIHLPIIYIFIPVGGCVVCVGRGLNAPLCSGEGAIMLLRWH